MAHCKDDITTHVKRFKYNTIYPPRTDAAPLELLAKKDGSLISWGQVDDVLDSSATLPTIQEAPNPMDIEGKIASTHDMKIGITLLKKLIAAVGGNLGIKATYKRARSLTFRYQDVTRSYVKPIDLDRFMSQAVPDNGLLTTYELLSEDRLFVFTSVIKARKVVVEAEKNNGESLEVDVPAVKEIVGGNIKVTSENESNTKIVYEGQIPVGFGFKAVQIDFDKGRLRMQPVKPGAISAAAVSSLSETDEPDRLYEVLVLDDDYVRLP